jgi:ParB family chromosome partitioning protein
MTTLLHIPLDQIDDAALLRDRGPLDDTALTELVNSIALIGLSQPIEVWALSTPEPPLAYGLISGLRRLTACRRLRDPRGNGDFATIPALLRTPDSIPDAMARMVAENEVRTDVTPWEKGTLILDCVARDLFPTADAAVDALWRGHSRQKRARLRAFADVVGELDGAFTAPGELSTQRMERLSAAIRAGLGDIIHAALAPHRGETLASQWSALLPVIDEAVRSWEPDTPTTPGRPRRMLHLKQGLTIRREKRRTGWALVFTGPEAKEGGLLDDVFDLVEKWLQRGN